jgi:predicted PurR-regulated permease PerM
MESNGSAERFRRYQLLLVIAAVVVVTWMIWAARGSLFPFAIGLVIAYLLAPLVNRVQRLIPQRGFLGRARRTIAVVIVYLIALGIFGFLLLSFGARIVHQTIDLANNMPAYVESVREQSKSWNNWYEETIPPDLQKEIEKNLDEAGTVAADAAKAALLATVGTVQRVIGLIAGLALLPLWLFYLLKDQGKAFDFFYRLWPEPVREDVRNIVGIADNVLGAYIRGQLILGFVVGAVTFVGLWAFDVSNPIALGVVAGIFEMVPILGPWLSFIAAAIVVLATDPEKIWIIIPLFLGIQQLENTFLVPKIQGDAVNMNPAIIMVLLVLGGALFGIIGVIVIVPFAAIARDVFIYVYNRLSEEAGVRGQLLPEPEGAEEGIERG